jgi:hypothetical protein
MPKDPSNPPVKEEVPGAPSEGMRNIISLLLFIHLFCVFVALCASHATSALESRFLGVIGFYCQTLNFDFRPIPNVVQYVSPYRLTHGEEIDVDHLIEVLPEGQDESDAAAWIELSNTGMRGGERRNRYERLGEQIDALVRPIEERPNEFRVEFGNRAGLFASAIGTYSLNQRGTTPKQIRFRRHRLVGIDAYRGQDPEMPRDPNAPINFQVFYAANAVVEEGSPLVEIVPLDAAGSVARPTESK